MTKRITIETLRGGQVRRYGPSEYEYIIDIEHDGSIPVDGEVKVYRSTGKELIIKALPIAYLQQTMAPLKISPKCKAAREAFISKYTNPEDRYDPAWYDYFVVECNELEPGKLRVLIRQEYLD